MIFDKENFCQKSAQAKAQLYPACAFAGLQ